MSSPNTNKKIMLPKTCMKLPCRKRQVISVSGARRAPRAGPAAAEERGRNQACGARNPLRVAGREAGEPEKDAEIDRDQRPHHVRRCRPPERAVIPQRHDHGLPSTASAILARLPQHV